MKLRTTSIADVDAAEAALWLEQQQPGLGDRFLEALDKTFAQITNRPQSSPTLVSSKIVFKSQLRSATISSFEYQVIFSIQADEVVIVGVLHGHRDLDAILSKRVGTI